MTAMLRIIFAVVLLLHVGYSITSTNSSPNGSHNLFKLKRSNDSVRNVRCTPCEDTNLKRPVSNHLDPEYRGNGADNLGYDWSPMAWGGLAFPRKSNMRGMRGRDGKMMSSDGVRNQDSSHVICDTCRSYWYDGGNGGGSGKGGDRGRQFNMYGDQNGYWQGGKMPDNYETRVMSPTVGVLVKPGSRIAYIPSRSGEMYWDGVSGGGTRWDGFSNGISWVGGNNPQWDRSDTDGAAFPKPGENPYGPNGFGAYGNQPIPPNWGGNPGRQYYFTNGVPNDIDPQRRDRGYASNWHYGSTSQNGWNDNSMKWNFGGKQWADNDRAANRFYFNTPQDRTYGPGDGIHRQYGNQYPNYQEPAEYRYNLRPGPWSSGGGFRPNDRFPSTFQQDNFNNDDSNRPWDYNSGGSFGQRPRPFGGRPGSGYPDKNLDNFVRGPYGNYDKITASDKNDYEKPLSKPSYSSSKPSGSHRPDEVTGGSARPSYPGDVSHLFIPNDGKYQLVSTTAGSGNYRPTYPSGPTKFGSYPSSENQIGSEGNNRFPVDHGGSKRPSVIYTGGGIPESGGRYPSGGRPSGGYPSSGSSGGSYPSGGGSSGSYPSGGGSSGSYPSGGGSSGSYPSGGGSSGSYPSGGGSAGSYPSGGGSSGSYPSGGGTSGGYPSGGRPTGGYPSGGGSSGYPVGGGSSGYPSSGRPSEGYPSGGRPSGGYPSGGRPSGGYPSGGRPIEGYPSGGGSSGYPVGGGSSGYPSGGRPSEGYPSGVRPSGGYPSGGRPTEGYPSGGGSSGYPSGGRPIGGYPGGSSGGSYPSGGSFSGGSVPGTYPSGSRPSEYVRPSAGYPNPNYPFGVNRPGSYPSDFSPSAHRPGVYNGGNRPDNYYSGVGYPVNPGDGGSGYPGGSIRPGPYPAYPNTGHLAGGRPVYPAGGRPDGFSGSGRPDGYFGGSNPNRGGPSQGNYPSGGKKGYYTGFITEISPDDRPVQYGGQPSNYFGGVYPGDKNYYPGKDSDKYYGGGSYPGGHSSGNRNKYPAYSEDRYSTNEGGGYSDGGNDKYYYGQHDGKNKYPNGGYPSNHRYPSEGLDGYDRNQGSSSDKNSWNYGQSERKDGIYRRSGGSYPPYRGGQYYTSSYLASMSTTAGSTPSGSEPKTQSVTKSDEVTEATPDSS